MFLLTNKALIWVGKGQKEKPQSHHYWGLYGRVMVPGMSAQKRRTKQVRMVPRQSFSYKNKVLRDFWDRRKQRNLGIAVRMGSYTKVRVWDCFSVGDSSKE